MDARTTAEGPTIWLRWRPNGLPVGLWVVFALLGTGCRSDPNMQLVERELRAQDQHIFELEEHLADCHAVVAAYRREIASLRGRLDDGADAGNSEEGELQGGRQLPAAPRSNDFSLPNIDEGDLPSGLPNQPRSSRSANGPEDADSPLQGKPPAPDEATSQAEMYFPTGPQADPSGQQLIDSASEELPPPDLSDSADAVDRIDLHRMIHYHVADDVPVEIQAVVQPRDHRAQQVRAVGDISLMLVATSTTSTQQLARWDFPAAEVRNLWGHSPLGTGMQFYLPWPGSPDPGTYRLWARFVGDDGRKHLHNVDFEIEQQALAQGPPVSLDRLNDSAGNQARLATSSGDQVAPPAEQRPTGSVAWRASVEAASLPRRAQPASPGQVAVVDQPTVMPASESEIVPWSPQRPISERRRASDTAAGIPDWSPYR